MEGIEGTAIGRTDGSQQPPLVLSLSFDDVVEKLVKMPPTLRATKIPPKSDQMME